MSECFKTNVLPDNLVNVFANVDKEDRSNNQSFWLFVEALQVFYQDFKRLPLSGVVPDMISTTENYLTLQRIYID
jgi:amyloid beta precursor protein binding protein 1